MGAFDWLSQGVAPVQLADPMQMAARGMTLANLARQNRVGAEEEQYKSLDRQSDMLASQGLMRFRQSGDAQSVLADLAQQGEAGALAARKMAKFVADQQKADDESAYKKAQTGELTAKAEKDRAGVKVDAIKQFATLGTAIASGQAPINSTTQGAAYEIANAILPPEVVRTMPADPARFREWMTVLSSPESLSKIAKESADTSKTKLETEQLPAELAVRQSNARSSAVSAGAAATNAQTNRMQYTNPNLQHVSDGQGGMYAFNPRGGSFNAATDAAGQPLPRAEKPLTETQGNATAFGMRMKSANDIINDLEAKGADLGSLPNRYLPASTLGNYIASPEAQAAYQAKLNFMTASLRKESGAAISPSEFENEDKKYFPQPGDSAELRAQKRAARELALKAMTIQAGPGGKNVGNTGSADKSAGTTFDSMPDPAKYAGRRVRADDGTVYRSDGKSWRRE